MKNDKAIIKLVREFILQQNSEYDIGKIEVIPGSNINESTKAIIYIKNHKVDIYLNQNEIYKILQGNPDKEIINKVSNPVRQLYLTGNPGPGIKK